MRARNQNNLNIKGNKDMEKKTKIIDKDFSWYLGMEDETEGESI